VSGVNNIYAVEHSIKKAPPEWHSAKSEGGGAGGEISQTPDRMHGSLHQLDGEAGDPPRRARAALGAFCGVFLSIGHPCGFW